MISQNFERRFVKKIFVYLLFVYKMITTKKAESTVPYIGHVYFFK